MDYAKSRRSAALAAVKADCGADALYVTDPVNVAYLCGRTRAVPGAVLMLTDKRALLVTPPDAPDGVGGPGVEVAPARPTWGVSLSEIVGKEMGGRKFGVEADTMPLAVAAELRAQLPKATAVHTFGLVERLRSIKDAGEVEALRNAARVSSRAFSMLTALLRDSDTEADMSAAMDGFLRRAGADGSAVPSCVLIGEGAAEWQARPGATVLSSGSKFLVRWGANCGYQVAYARAWPSPFGVAPSRRNKAERVTHSLTKVVEAAVAVRAAAAKACQPGVSWDAVAAAAGEALNSVDAPEIFSGDLAFGLGLTPRELPVVPLNSRGILTGGPVEAGQVVALGLTARVPGWGAVELYDPYLVTRNGAVPLIVENPPALPAP